ncbi:MAG: DUF2877 domain-containing protein [Ardenticatenales bacterium]|nr:DUF2877 domain-containing protein [Ardenticatenales bacterium]
MHPSQRAAPPTIRALDWGELAASRLGANWLARVWEATPESLLLVDQSGEVVHLVTPAIGNGPFRVVVPEEAAARWESLPRDFYTWRVRGDLWLGDNLTLSLPEQSPWSSALSWEGPPATVDEILLSRHLALLGDWLMARAPEATIGGILPDLLNMEPPSRHLSDLPGTERLFRWRASRALTAFLESMVSGDLAAGERAVNSLAGLGPGSPPVGDSFILGFMAGVQLWPEFVRQGSGLRISGLLPRLARSAAERTSPLGRASLLAALGGQWSARWHELYAALTANGPYADEIHRQIEQVAALWLAQDKGEGSAALTGVVIPFLWFQRFLV